jgi:hypothetical protein
MAHAWSQASLSSPSRSCNPGSFARARMARRIDPQLTSHSEPAWTSAMRVGILTSLPPWRTAPCARSWIHRWTDLTRDNATRPDLNRQYLDPFSRQGARRSTPVLAIHNRWCP